MWRNVIVAGVILTLGCSSAFAENAVFVESKTVGMGASGRVGVFLTNDEPLRGITMILVVREITPGVYPTAITAMYVQEGRLRTEGPWPWPLFENVFIGYYDAEDGNCKQGQPGGFGTITISGGGASTVVVPSPSNPDGFKFHRSRTAFPDLPPGDDGDIPSIAFDITAPMAEGSFEIDTTCCDPACHLLLVNPSGLSMNVVFTKGVVDVVPCDCPFQADIEPDGFITALDLSACIDVLFAGSPDIQDPICPSPRFDFDCDGFSTALDLGNLIDHLFAGGQPPCNPCGAF